MSARVKPQAAPQVVEVPVERLRLWPENPRRISDVRLEDLKKAMCADPEMLWARPLLALRDGTVFAGNQRLRAALELGWPTIPVITVDLDPTRARLWALRDNNQYGEWDEAALAELLAELAAGDIDLLLSGFAGQEIDRLLAGVGEIADPDAVPPLPEKPESKPGELYELGPHRLLCGDATDPEQLALLMGDEQAEVLLTDPPYGVDYTGKTAKALRIANDNADRLPQLLRDAFAAADRVLAPCARFYISAPAGPRGLDFRLAIGEAGWRLHQVLVWVKQAPVLGHSDYHYQHEDILFGWTPGRGRPGRGRHQGSRWFGDNAQTSVFFVDRPSCSSEHPTMKPVALIGPMLENSSRRGEIVLDPFVGSGSSLIACERLGRRCYAVELDPRYCDVIRARYQRHRDAG